MTARIFLMAILSSLGPWARAQEPMVWQQRANVGSPGLIEGAAMACHEEQGVIVLFGGDKYPPGAATSIVSNEVWQYNGTAWQQVTVTGPQPQARSGHSMVHDPVDGRLLMFGGDGGGVNLADLWAFDFTGPATGVWVQLASLPSAGRAGSAMGYDATNDRFIVTGGIKEGTAAVDPEAGAAYGSVKPATRETWKWNRSIWSAGPLAPLYNNGPLQNNPNAGPVPHFIMAGPLGGTIAHHGASGKTMLLSERMFPVIGVPLANYVYGVGDYPLYTPDAWGLNAGGVRLFGGGNWPGYFNVASYSRIVATYDPVRRRVIAFGAGKSNSEEFDGEQWAGPGTTIRGAFGPLPAGRSRPCLAHDSTRGVTVFFGGKASLTDPGDTWELVENPSVPFAITTDLSTAPLEPCEGGSITLTGAASGVGPFRWRWFKDGLELSTTTAPTITLTNLPTSMSGQYRFEVEDASGRRRTSATTPVLVHGWPAVTTPPPNRRVAPGEGFALFVEVSSTLPLTYQWHRNGAAIPGANDRVYRAASSSSADAGTYKVTISSRCHVLDSAPCQVHVGPTILTQPQALLEGTTMQGGSTFQVTGDGVGEAVGAYSVGSDPAQYPFRHAPDSPAHPRPMAFQWRHEGVPLAPGPKYVITNAAKSSQLTIIDPDYEDEGEYDCVVTDASGPAHAKVTQKSLLILNPLTPPYTTIQHGGGPEPRGGAGMVFDSWRRRAVLFGGYCYGPNPRTTSPSATYFHSNDTWEWDGRIWVKRNPSTKPPVLSEFGMAYDSNRGVTVVYGGKKFSAPLYNSFTISNEVWEWDGSDWRQVFPTTHPHARTRPTMAFDSIRNEVLMLGANSLSPEPSQFGYSIRKQLWAWDGTDWTPRGQLPGGEGAPYVYGENQAFVFDPVRGVAALFGPFDDGGTYAVWEWNGSAWIRKIPVTYANRLNDSRAAPHAFFDPVRRRIGVPCVSNNLANPMSASVPLILWWDGGDFRRGDTLTHDDVNQTTLTAGVSAGPWGQGFDLACYDPVRRSFLWHDTPQFLWDGPAKTREMHFTTKVKTVYQPVEVLFFQNGTVEFRGIHAGKRPLVHQWMKDGSPLFDDARVTGSSTATVRITNATAADAGRYSLRATNIHNQVETLPINLRRQADGTLGTVVQGAGMILHWNGAGAILESAREPAGPWQAVPLAASPHTVAMDEGARFFRVRYP